MAAQNAPRPISMLGDDSKPPIRKAPVAAGAVIFHGSLVGRNGSGYWEPASTSIRPLGLVDLEMYNDLAFSGQSHGDTFQMPGYKVDNSAGLDGARSIVVRCGVFKLFAKGGDEPTAAMVGAPVYCSDDQTVQATGGGVVAGILHGFSDSGEPLVLIESAATE